MEFKFVNAINQSAETLVLGISDNLKLSPKAEIINKKFDNVISLFLKSSSFKGAKDEIKMISFNNGKNIQNIILIGLGSEKEFSNLRMMKIGGKIYASLNANKFKSAHIIIDFNDKKYKDKQEEFASYVAYGLTLRNYKFSKYRTKDKESHKVAKLEVYSNNVEETKKTFQKLQKIASGVFLTRDLVTEPPNVIYPESLAQICMDELTPLGVTVEILNEKDMKKLGMGSLLGVGQGSSKESRLVVMQWNGNSKAKDKKPLAFIGKGVTFDTGGISIKPSLGMEDMKYDMAGSATVIGLMKALAERKAKVNAVGIVGLVENMPGSNAQRPSDVVKSMSGQTIEVLNTDAEGRLVLADALWYCQNRFKPKFMVDLATLTGAITITFGAVYAGLFSNNDDLAARLTEAGQKTGERLWQLPLGEEYDKQINSDIADMQNIGNEKGAGSITAAQFLQRFVNDVPWAHLDIAGVAWTRKEQDITPKGATAFGVRLLNQLIEDNFEGK